MKNATNRDENALQLDAVTLESIYSLKHSIGDVTINITKTPATQKSKKEVFVTQYCTPGIEQ